MLIALPLKLRFDLSDKLVRVTRLPARLRLCQILEEVEELLVLLGKQVHENVVGSQSHGRIDQLVRLLSEGLGMCDTF